LPRTTRVLGIAGALASTAVLAACSKPVPLITVQSGSFSTTVTPSTYAFDATHTRTSGLTLPEVSARGGGSVLIDVPREVVNHGWEITAFALDSAHTAVGNSGPILNSHSYRVVAGANSGNPFIVQVLQLSHGKPDGSVWSFLVKVSSAT
jgi:hypothetical protein